MTFFPWISTRQDLVSENMTIDYKDYEVSEDGTYMTGHRCQGIEAIKAWALRCLKTKRYKYPIYSWDYGISVEDHIGHSYSKELIDSEISRDISETLLLHPNVKSVTDFNIEFENDSLFISCTINTDFGGVDIAI